MTALDWRGRAACFGDDPAEWDLETDYAVGVCESCPVRAECLADAMRTVAAGGVLHAGGGVRGGLTEDQRAQWHRRGRYEASREADRRSRQTPKLTAAQHEHRLELARAGWSDREIALACGVSAGAIRSWRGRSNVPPGPKERQSNSRAAQRRDLYDQGFSDDQIARATGFGPDAIRHWRNREGLPSQNKRQLAVS